MTHGPVSQGSQRRPSQGAYSPRPVQNGSSLDEDIELECPHCMLPIDSLDEPCPFCNKMPRFGKEVLVVDDDYRSRVPFGIRTISLFDKLLGVMYLLMASIFLIPLFAEAEIGFLIASMFMGSWGYLHWRLGTDLLERKHWARTTQTVLSVLSLFGVPFGTVMGTLYLWGLHSERADDYFDEKPLLPEK